MSLRYPLRVPVRALSLALAVLVVAFGLRLWDLGGASVWHDEAWSIRAIRDPIGTPDDNTPPLYYSLCTCSIAARAIRRASRSESRRWE